MKLTGSILIIGCLALAACGKPVEPPKATVVVETPVTVVPSVTPVPQSTTVQPVETTPTPQPSKVAKVVVVKKKASTKTGAKVGVNTVKVDNKTVVETEKAAYQVAAINRVIYLCLEKLWVQVTEPPPANLVESIDSDRMGFAQRCLAVGIVDVDQIINEYPQLQG